MNNTKNILENNVNLDLSKGVIQVRSNNSDVFSSIIVTAFIWRLPDILMGIARILEVIFWIWFGRKCGRGATLFM